MFEFFDILFPKYFVCVFLHSFDVFRETSIVIRMRESSFNPRVRLTFWLVVYIFIYNLSYCPDWWSHLLQYVAVCSCKVMTCNKAYEYTAGHFLKMDLHKLCVLRNWHPPLTWHDWLRSDRVSEVQSSIACFPLLSADTRRDCRLIARNCHLGVLQIGLS